MASLTFAAWSLTGFFIWAGYRWRWALDRFPFFSRRQFWTLSLLHHFGWLILFPLFFGSFSFTANFPSPSEFLEFWFVGPWLLFFWLLGKITIAATSCIKDKDPHSRKESASQPV